MAKTRKRKSLTLRFQPYEGSTLAEVVDYLNSLDKDEANKKAADILLMCLLPYARKHGNHSYSHSELRLTCLESCDCMDKHASSMRQALMVEQPKFSQQYIAVSAGGYNGNGGELQEEPDAEEVSETIPSTLIKGHGSAAEADMLFGDWFQG